MKNYKNGPDETVQMGLFKYIGYDEERSKTPRINSKGKNIFKTYWKIQCKCGKITSVLADNFIRQKTTSCGCDKKLTGKNNKTFKGFGEIHLGYWWQLQNGAKKRNLDFTITIEYAWELFLKQNRKCKLTGLDIVFPKYRYSPENKTLMKASLDRIDSSKGYVPGNVQWIYQKINFMKQNYTETEFINLCKLVYKHSLSGSVE